MTWNRGRTLLAAGAFVLVAVTGCGGGQTSPSRATSPSASLSPAEVVDRALSDIERFWTATYPTISEGKPFQPVQGGYHPYTQGSSPPASPNPDAIAGGAAFCCPEGDFIAYDDQKLRALYEQLGDNAVGLLLRATGGSGASGFERITAYRKGVLEGLSACE